MITDPDGTTPSCCIWGAHVPGQTDQWLQVIAQPH
jgi:hypothetical protein